MMAAVKVPRTAVGAKSKALLAGLEDLVKRERACKEVYETEDDPERRGLYIDAKYTAVWLEQALPHLRRFLVAHHASGKEFATAVLTKLNSLRNDETPDYGWRQVVRIVGETLGLDEETREEWESAQAPQASIDQGHDHGR